MLTMKDDRELENKAAAHDDDDASSSSDGDSSSLPDASDSDSNSSSSSSSSGSSSDSDDSSSDSSSDDDSLSSSSDEARPQPGSKAVNGKSGPSKGGPNNRSKNNSTSSVKENIRSAPSGGKGRNEQHFAGKDHSSPRTGVLFATNPPGKKRRPLAIQAVNVQDRSGQTPVFRYADHGDVEAVQMLIDAGADINIKDNGGWTPLHKAAVNGHLEVANVLIKYGADVNAASNCHDTPLHDAAENGYVDVVQKLLQSGAYLNARNNKNQTALDVAGEQEVTDCLTKWEEMVPQVNAPDAEGRIPLHVAASQGNVPEIMTQVFYGANLRRRDNCGYTPLHLAALFGHADAVHHLLRLGAEVDSANDEMDTPLLDAATNGHPKVVELLLKYGANVESRNRDGKAPTDECTDSSCLELLGRPRSSWKPFAEPEWMLRPFPGSTSEILDLRGGVHGQGQGHGTASDAGTDANAAAHQAAKGNLQHQNNDRRRRNAPGRPRAGSLVSESGSSHVSGTNGGGAGSENGSRSAKGHHSTIREANQLGWGFAWFDAVKDISVTREERKLQALMKIIEKQEGGGKPAAGTEQQHASHAAAGQPHARPNQHNSDKDSVIEFEDSKAAKKAAKEKKEKERLEKKAAREERKKEKEAKKKDKKDKKKEKEAKSTKAKDPNQTPKKRGRPPKHLSSSAQASPGVSPETLRIRQEEEEQLEILKRELAEIEEKQRSSREGSYDYEEWGSHKKKKKKASTAASAKKSKDKSRDEQEPGTVTKRGPGRPRKNEASSPMVRDETMSDGWDESHGIKRERDGKDSESAPKRVRRRSLSPVIESAPAPRRGARKLDALASLFGDQGSSAEDEEAGPERMRSPMMDSLLEQARLSGDLPPIRDEDVVMEDAGRTSDAEGSDAKMRSREASPAPQPKSKAKAAPTKPAKAEKAEKEKKEKPEKSGKAVATAAAAKQEAPVPVKKPLPPKPKPKPAPVKVAPPPPPPEPVVVARAKKKKVSLFGMHGGAEESSTPVVETAPKSSGVDSVVAAAALLGQVEKQAVAPVLAPSETTRVTIPDVAMKGSVDIVELSSAALPSLPSAPPAAEAAAAPNSGSVPPPPIFIPKISLDEATALAALTALHDHSVVSASGSPTPAAGEALAHPTTPQTPPLTNQSSTSSNSNVNEQRPNVTQSLPTAGSAAAVTLPPTSSSAPPAGGYVHKLKRLPPNKRFEEPASAGEK